MRPFIIELVQQKRKFVILNYEEDGDYLCAEMPTMEISRISLVDGTYKFICIYGEGDV